MRSMTQVLLQLDPIVGTSHAARTRSPQGFLTWCKAFHHLHRQLFFPAGKISFTPELTSLVGPPTQTHNVVRRVMVGRRLKTQASRLTAPLTERSGVSFSSVCAGPEQRRILYRSGGKTTCATVRSRVVNEECTVPGPYVRFQCGSRTRRDGWMARRRTYVPGCEPPLFIWTFSGPSLSQLPKEIASLRRLLTSTAAYQALSLHQGASVWSDAWQLATAWGFEVRSLVHQRSRGRGPVAFRNRLSILLCLAGSRRSTRFHTRTALPRVRKALPLPRAPNWSAGSPRS